MATATYLFGNLQALYLDGSSQILWQLDQEHLPEKWTIAEALIPAGHLQIEFAGDIRRGSFAVDDISVTSLKGIKGELLPWKI